jgi:disulfide bond formation protein DsbB
MSQFKKYLSYENLLYACLSVSLAATGGSLYYSEILGLPPCELCWFQRIFMYPLVVLFAVAIIKKDHKVHQYVIPIALLGTFYAFYHVLLQEGLINEDITKCISGIPCADESNVIYGIITIPFLSLLSFLAIDLMMFYVKYFKRKE